MKTSDVSTGSKSSKGSKGSKGSEVLSWRMLSFGRRSVGRVHTNFSLHTRLASVVVEDRQDAFDPNSTLVKVWEQVLLLCLLHESFLLPYFLAFQPGVFEQVSVLFVVVILCEVVFAVDLYVRAHTGYHSDGNLIRDTKRTIKMYVRSRKFALDVIAILPTQMLVAWYPHEVVKLLFVKLVRWSRFPHLVSNLDEFYARHFVVLKLLKVLASTVYLAHVLACIRYSFGEDKSHSNSWLPPESSESSAHDNSLHRHYLVSLFWSVGIMTGLFEGELPKRATEFLFTILVALCGFAMFTTLCATIFVISKCESDNAEAMGARINQLVHVLSFHRVPEKQQAKAIEYLKRYYTDAESTDRETAKLLCPSIANDIQVELLKSTIAHVSLFSGCSDQFIVALTSLLEMIAVPAQTTLFSAGDYGDAIWHVQESPASMELYDQKLRSVYKKERMAWDILAAIPFYDLVALFSCIKWLKLLRCIKILNILSYLDELNRRGVANDAKRFWHVWVLYLLMMYWTACAYLAVATEAGFGTQWDSWLPSEELNITDPHDPSATQLFRRFLRGLFFATTMFVKKGYSPDPDTASLYAFHIAISFTGLIAMSFAIGELASLFISFIGLEVGFRKNHIAVELYMTRLRISEHIRSRTYAFMTSLWSSHAGVNYEELLEEMPQDIRASCVLHVSKKPLEWFVMKVITPVCWEGDESIDALTLSLADRLRFETYPRDENVVTEGSIVRAMYFVIKGHLTMQSRSLKHRPLGLRDGSYFGERGLLGSTISAYTVRTARACDLLSLSSEAFAQVLQKHSFTRLALKLCERAYKKLKEQHITTCSKRDMEEHWGAALLLILQEIKSCQLSGVETINSAEKKGIDALPVVGILNAEFTAVSSFLPVEPAPDVNKEEKTTFPTETQSSAEQESSVGMSPAATGGTEETEEAPNIIKELGELPANMGEMFEALKTSRTCFEAFAPLLHILLATDPLDWKTSFWVCVTRGVSHSEGLTASVSIDSTPKSIHRHQSGPLIKQSGTAE
ncbi:Cyclic nucleotide-gated cation channel alpha-3 [Phytophthora cinnamomi]|uniref:Cyclic nucleotide-gated cation channel alpha-3 n=1 Tax=Phytophthora cinnamomi TaxID=4785 RepID=UPI00355A8E7A|nr:Cyclic nucleotide-gated cation channel alpha-3 [Phytophthora cinnamomi]